MEGPFANSALYNLQSDLTRAEKILALFVQMTEVDHVDGLLSTMAQWANYRIQSREPKEPYPLDADTILKMQESGIKLPVDENGITLRNAVLRKPLPVSKVTCEEVDGDDDEEM